MFEKTIAEDFTTEVKLYEYEIPKDIALSEVLVDEADYLQYRDELSSRVSVDQYYLLERQKNVYVKAYGEEAKVINLFNMLLDREVGNIRDVNCIESLLFSIQNKNFPMISSHQEFSSYFFIKGDTMRVILSIAKESSLGAPLIKAWRYKILEYTKNGWRFTASYIIIHFFSNINQETLLEQLFLVIQISILSIQG